jgi:acetoin utilization deacetylase AcuC-like enzyme
VRTGLASDPIFEQHDTGPGHPERPERLPALLNALEGLDLVAVEPREATREEIEAAHSPDYVSRVEDAVSRGVTHLDADTVLSPRSFEAAVKAAGAGLALAEALLDGRIEAGFAAVRPPGHHACTARAMGFCLFNNIAILARFLHARGQRVCIVDWDVHHGNGTEEIFRNDASIGFCSLHQSPLYPGTGSPRETGAGNIRNIPLPPASGESTYLRAFDDQVLPWLEERSPDVVLVSCGFDAHALDPLANMELLSGSYAEFTRRLTRWPVLSLLEGGYSLEAMAEGGRAHIEALTEA